MKCPKDNFSKVTYIFLFFRMSIAHSCARVTGGAGANVLICVCLPFALGTQCVCVCFFYNLVGLVKTVIDCNTFHSHPPTVCLTAGRPIALVLCACISQSINIFGKYLSCGGILAFLVVILVCSHPSTLHFVTLGDIEGSA